MTLYHNISEDAFGLAFQIAADKLALMDPVDLCTRTGAIYLDKERILLVYLNRKYLIHIPNGEISLLWEEEKGVDIPFRDKILILHYLTQAKGSPLTGRLINYAQLKGGRFYCPVFQKRTIDPILKAFGKRPEILITAGEGLGSSRASYGDVSIQIDPFPKVRIFIIIWKGDDEVPSNGNILFDKNISDYLTVEDVAVLSEIIIWKLVSNAGDIQS